MFWRASGRTSDPDWFWHWEMIPRGQSLWKGKEERGNRESDGARAKRRGGDGETKCIEGKREEGRLIFTSLGRQVIHNKKRREEKTLVCGWKYFQAVGWADKVHFTLGITSKAEKKALSNVLSGTVNELLLYWKFRIFQFLLFFPILPSSKSISSAHLSPTSIFFRPDKNVVFPSVCEGERKRGTKRRKRKVKNTSSEKEVCCTTNSNWDSRKCNTLLSWMQLWLQCSGYVCYY